MFRNYLTVAIRTLIQYRVYSLINIAGLAIGIAASILILLFIQDELGYDTFHSKGNRIYRIATEMHSPDKPTEYTARTPKPLGKALLKDFPAIEQAVQLRFLDGYLARGDKKFYESRILYADPTIFEVFSFPLMEGDSRTVLKAPNSIVMTQAGAQKYFGDEDPIGKTILADENETLLVTGVLAPIPRQSHIHFDFLRPLPDMGHWWWWSWYTYILVKENTPIDALEEQIYDVASKYVAEQETKFGLKQRFFLQPLFDIYLHSDLRDEIEPMGNITYIYLFSVISILILFLACINFMNLSTARASIRAREIGMRKVLGATRIQIARQFLGESILMAIIGATAGVALVEIILPTFNEILAKSLEIDFLNNGQLALGLGLITLIVGFLSGSYPAFSLSGAKTIGTPKGFTNQAVNDGFLRKGLVVFQFAITIILVISTAVVYNQLSYMKNQRLGFGSEHVVVIPFREINKDTIKEKYRLFKAEFQKLKDVMYVTFASSIPGRDLKSAAVHPEGAPKDEMRSLESLSADPDFVNTMGLEMIAGRYFSEDYGTDSKEAFVVNEAALTLLGWKNPEEAIGKTLEWNLEKKGRIVGVVKDYHHLYLRKMIAPQLIHIYPRRFDYVSVKIHTENIEHTLANIEQVWKKLVPDKSFEFFFLNEYYDRQYRSEERLGNIFGAFAGLAIFIACLGLFGLSAFTAERRTKEIGIRKVLGASVSTIVILLSKDFLKLVIAANVIAWPVAYWAMRDWLMNFAYRIDLGLGTFILSGGLALLIALLTVSFQAWKAACANPVDALRNE